LVNCDNIGAFIICRFYWKR